MGKRKILLLAACVSFDLLANAQVPSVNPLNGVVPAIVNTAGNSYDNKLSYYRYEWSLGELLLVQAFATADSSLMITHGVLQPCTEKIGNSPLVLLFEAGDYKLFPNPTTGRFEIDFFINTPGQMRLQLINSIGQVLETRSYYYDGCCRIELFDITHHPAGIYFLVADHMPAQVRSDGLQVNRHSGFKIVKVN